mmetsp:Transcript_47035/g.87949  ORF Transcript_47035/g.87949 Transcript_47035/m.87949 type:complete len:217 (-) Transcript_47035:49-699(-)
MEFCSWAQNVHCGKQQSSAFSTVMVQAAETVAAPPPSAPVDRRGVWRDYDPDSDDYDPRSAPMLPPPEDKFAQVRRQAACLRSRIKRGGPEHVLLGYRRVLEELESSMLPPIRKVIACHKRTPSSQSASTESTSAPDDEMIVDSDIEEVEEMLHDGADDEIPEEAPAVADARRFTKKTLPGDVKRRPIPLYRVYTGARAPSTAAPVAAAPLAFAAL